MKNPMHTWSRAVIVAALAVLTVAAATRPALADRETVRTKLPYYAGKAPASGTIAHTGVAIGKSFTDPGSKDLPQVLIERLPDFNAALAAMGAFQTLEMADPPAQPGVYVGAPNGFYAPPEVSMADTENLQREAVVIRGVDAPSGWRKSVGVAAQAAGADYVLVVRLELSDYPVLQKNWKGSKAVALGTGHIVPVPWLTSLDQPVEVLQWTGTLLKADGKVVHVGAEAFHALRTPFMESAFKVQRTITPDVLEQALDARRDDLPGAPPSWRVALANLVGQLTGRKVPVMAAEN